MPENAGYGPEAQRALLFALSGLGASLGGSGSVGAELGRSNQQTIAAQNYKDLLRQFLADQDNKITMDSKGVKIQTGPKGLESMLSSEQERTTGLGELSGLLPGMLTEERERSIGIQDILGIMSGTTGGNRRSAGFSSPAPTSQPELRQFPFSSSPLVDLGLVGLTPRDVSSAFEHKRAQDELARKRASDVLDAIYRRDVSRRAAGTEERLERQFAHRQKVDRTRLELETIGETRKILKDLEPDEKTREEKLYEAAGGKKGTGLSFAKFFWVSQDTDATKWEAFKILEPEKAEKLGGYSAFLRAYSDAKSREYQDYVETGGDLTRFEWATALAEASRAQINVGERAFETAQGRQRAYYGGPDLVRDVARDLGLQGDTSDAAQRQIFEEMDRQIKASGALNNPVFGRRDGVIGWYNDGGEGELIRPWSR